MTAGQPTAIGQPSGIGRALCQARAWKANHLCFTGDYTGAIEEAERAIKLAGELSMTEEDIIARRARGMSRAWSGDVGAIDELREVVTLSEELGGLVFGMSMNYLAVVQRDIEGPAAAGETFLSTIAFCDQRGFTMGGMNQRLNMLDVLFQLGRWQEIPAQAERLIELGRTTDYRHVESYATLSLVQVLLPTGRIAESSTLRTRSGTPTQTLPLLPPSRWLEANVARLPNSPMNTRS